MPRPFACPSVAGDSFGPPVGRPTSEREAISAVEAKRRLGHPQRHRRHPAPRRSPREHLQHLPHHERVESPFAALRLRTDGAKRYKRGDRATAVIWKMLMIAEKRFRRLKAPELMRDICDGAQHIDRERLHTATEEVAA